MKASIPTPGDEYIDSRDVIKAIDDLMDERAALAEALDEANVQYVDFVETCPIADQRSHAEELAHDELLETQSKAEQALEEWDNDHADELAELQSLAEQCDGCGDWQHGETLILDSEFVDYAQQLAEDIGAFNPRNPKVQWPLNCIDWEQAARELQMDYSSVTFGDYEYWVRN